MRLKIENTDSRRSFLKFLSVFGFYTILDQSNPTKAHNIIFDNGNNNEITIETIKEAEKIIGINFTNNQRKEILKGLKSNLEYIDQLRAQKIEDNIFPINTFLDLQSFDNCERKIVSDKVNFFKIRKPGNTYELSYLSIPELAYLIKNKEISSVELTKHFISRLRKYDNKLKFLITLTEELAIQQASQADEEISKGDYKGVLHGIPYGLKDLFAVKKYKTTWGTEYFKDQVLEYNSTVYEKLKNAGAVLVAKLAMGAFASGDEWFGGVTKNPWDISRSSGGSSSGPASAVASGCIPFALGTETNGSMVSPCNECGTTGFRPSFGRISRYGTMSMSWSFDKITPISRSVEDCAIVYDSIKGFDGKDNSIIDRKFIFNNINLDQIKIGYHARFFENELMGNPQKGEYRNYLLKIRELNLECINYFKSKGKSLVPLDFNIESNGCGIMLELEAAASFDYYTRSKIFDKNDDNSWIKKFRQYKFIPAIDYINAARYRTVVITELKKALEKVDVYIEITWSNNWTTNLAGLPIIVVPCGFLYGRPVSVTFVGSFNKEDELFTVAHSFQKATSFHLKHPDLNF